MPINTIPLYYDGLSCLDNILISIAAWLKRDYQLVFFKSWNFEFKFGERYKNDLFSDRICIKELNYKILTEMYCGIHFKYNKVANVNETLRILANEFNKGRPAIIYMDSIWCPWKIEYQKVSAPHFCLALGINENGDLHCVDSAPLNYGTTLPLHDFLEGGGNCITFQIINSKLQNLEFEQIIKGALNGLYKQINGFNTFDSIRNFSIDLKMSFNLMKELKDNDLSNIWLVPIIKKLRSVSGGRSQYSAFLKYYYSKNNINDLLLLSSDLEFVSSRWNLIMRIIEKHIYSEKSVNVDNLSTIVSDIADLEEAIAQKLLHLVQ